MVEKIMYRSNAIKTDCKCGSPGGVAEDDKFDMTFDEIAKELDISSTSAHRLYENGINSILNIIDNDPKLTAAFSDYLSE
jgi:hypothetical protein